VLNLWEANMKDMAIQYTPEHCTTSCLPLPNLPWGPVFDMGSLQACMFEFWVERLSCSLLVWKGPS